MEREKKGPAREPVACGQELLADPQKTRPSRRVLIAHSKSLFFVTQE